MMQELTAQDRQFIWRVVDHAAEKAGSHANLFSNRLEFFEESGRIRFHWPTWMLAIKGYLNYQYGEKKTDSMLLSILREVMSEPNYQAYLRQTQDGKVSFNKKTG
ncbi:hypothetical protein [Aliikangiella sp. G2MR2-5]|uniref:hypothetical protein n=1 Tax=Aliikangiella sp. G2MR2-5 TaxID=2788943 RepID=UPI0018AB2620|nr:hypothetical protein [Aliikangiella sp. G2MR2-5]